MQVLFFLPILASTEVLSKLIYIQKSKINLNRKSYIISSNSFILHLPRGGGEHNNYLVPNQNYNNNNSNDYSNQHTKPLTLGDLDNNQIQRRPPLQQNYQQYDSSSFTSRQKPKPILQVIQEYFTQLYNRSPALYYGTITSIIIFLSWQIPNTFISNVMRNHFINSQYNLRKLRVHTLFTSMLSHNSFSHLAMNMYVFHTFGTYILSTLSANGISLSFYSIFAGIIANLFFLLVHPSGSCIGLSGVTLSFFTLYAKLNPGNNIGFFFHFIPIRLPAYYALIGLLLWSTFGTVMTMMGKGGGGVAHATHLGGILHGLTMYKLMKNGIWKNVIRRHWFVMRSKLNIKRLK